MKNIYITVFLSLLLVSTSYAQIYLSGELNGILVDTTYIVEDDIVVPSYLRIDPGAVLRFNDGVQFTLYGDLFAYGTITDSIYFELNDGAESWGGIDLDRDFNTGYAELEYCVVTGSNSSGIYVLLGHLIINNSRFSNNSAEEGGGIHVFGSHNIRSPIHSCVFSENSGGGIHIDGTQWNIQILDCVITNNIGTGLYYESRGPETKISNCIISNNVDTSEFGVGGIQIGHITEMDSPIDYCLINNNFGTLDGGISHPYEVDVDHCTFIGNRCNNRGSAIGSIEDDDSITNCIFDSNVGGLGAITVETSHYQFLAYNAFFNNSNVCSTRYNQGDILPNPYETIDRINVNGDSCDSFYNLYVDPLFEDREAYDFHLQADSPCINAGNPEYPLDGDNSFTDIGAYSFYQSGITEYATDLPVDFGIRKVYPNPFNNQTTIMINVQQPGNVGLYVYDILGRKVQTVTYSYKQSGIFLIPFNGNSLPSGNYFIHYCGMDGASSQKITLLK